MENEQGEDIQVTGASKCFMPLQSRPYWAPVSNLALCPSMDLMTLRLQPQEQQSSGGSSSSSSSDSVAAAAAATSPLWLHRTLDFYQLAAVGTAQAAVWRPDGRWLAVVTDGGRFLTLYHVEAMVTHGTSLAAHLEASLNESSLVDFTISSSGNILRFKIAEHDKDAVCHLHWAHCVTPSTSLYDRLRKNVSLTATDILPPSAYHLETNPGWVPTTTQPLSVLTVLKQNGTMDGFLMGQYPILKNLKLVNNSSLSTEARVQSLLDLSHWWMYERQAASSSTSLTLCSLPLLGKHRYTLQSVAVLYSCLMTHLHKLPTRLVELTEAYASSLKPLDLKWEALKKLFQQYGLSQEPIPKLLAQYILLGHAACTEDLSNAMDQFFTSMPMNEQLILRMDRSLTVAIANVESSLRQILAACQAILVQVDVLAGISHATSTPGLLPTTLITPLHQAAQHLVISAEACLTALVASRFRIRDWVAWMRATGSAIKARGTAPKSAQRENAKKRRLKDSALQRVLEYLRETSTTFVQNEEEEEGEKDIPSKKTDSLSARIMGLQAGWYWDDTRETVAGQENLWTLPHALAQTAETAQQALAAPRVYLQPHCRQTQVVLTTTSGITNGVNLCAVTCRRGSFWKGTVPSWTFPAQEASGYFTIPSEARSANVHQWALVAHAAPSCINLYALGFSNAMQTSDVSGEPVWDEFDSDEEEDDNTEELKKNHHGLESFYLTARLELPDDCQVEDLVFFGDDGQSNLYTDDSKPLQEKGQSLGLVIRRSEDTLELWVVPKYDEALWETHTLKEALSCLPDSIQLSACQGAGTLVEPGSPQDDDDASTKGTLSARVRVLSSSAKGTVPRLFVSGSRNIAAVVENQTTHARVGMLDLNEDEEEDDDDDDEDMDEPADN